MNPNLAAMLASVYGGTNPEDPSLPAGQPVAAPQGPGMFDKLGAYIRSIGPRPAPPEALRPPQRFQDVPVDQRQILPDLTITGVNDPTTLSANRPTQQIPFAPMADAGAQGEQAPQPQLTDAIIEPTPETAQNDIAASQMNAAASVHVPVIGAVSADVRQKEKDLEESYSGRNTAFADISRSLADTQKDIETQQKTLREKYEENHARLLAKNEQDATRLENIMKEPESDIGRLIADRIGSAFGAFGASLTGSPNFALQAILERNRIEAEHLSRNRSFMKDAFNLSAKQLDDLESNHAMYSSNLATALNTVLARRLDLESKDTGGQLAAKQRLASAQLVDDRNFQIKKQAVGEAIKYDYDTMRDQNKVVLDQQKASSGKPSIAVDTKKNSWAKLPQWKQESLDKVLTPLTNVIDILNEMENVYNKAGILGRSYFKEGRARLAGLNAKYKEVARKVADTGQNLSPGELQLFDIGDLENIDLTQANIRKLRGFRKANAFRAKSLLSSSNLDLAPKYADALED